MAGVWGHVTTTRIIAPFFLINKGARTVTHAVSVLSALVLLIIQATIGVQVDDNGVVWPLKVSNFIVVNMLGRCINIKIFCDNS